MVGLTTIPKDAKNPVRMDRVRYRVRCLGACGHKARVTHCWIYALPRKHTIHFDARSGHVRIGFKIAVEDIPERLAIASRHPLDVTFNVPHERQRGDFHVAALLQEFLLGIERIAAVSLLFNVREYCTIDFAFHAPLEKPSADVGEERFDFSYHKPIGLL